MYPLFSKREGEKRVRPGERELAAALIVMYKCATVYKCEIQRLSIQRETEREGSVLCGEKWLNGNLACQMECFLNPLDFCHVSFSKRADRKRLGGANLLFITFKGGQSEFLPQI